MAVPVHLFLKDDGGAMIRGGSDVQGREGSIELRGLTHNLSIPTDGATGKLTGTRQHGPFLFDQRDRFLQPIPLQSSCDRSDTSKCGT